MNVLTDHPRMTKDYIIVLLVGNHVEEDPLLLMAVEVDIPIYATSEIALLVVDNSSVRGQGFDRNAL